ncbi:FG-GAP-like repeat-containing protein [Synechocystis sp. LKSZ1]|uniref:FG-GAP-like repeat-containing protein n=1 Tax=Synechocystis sp. LKSZ1 TaxID=3144951 RepID=UPI00336BFD4F
MPDFTDLGNLNLSNVAYSSVAWGDYDNDGDLDVLLTGKEGGRVAKVFRNDSGSFTDINASLTAVYSGAVAWGDYDKDGDLDILLTGNSSGGRIAKVYRNDSGSFSDINASLVGVSSGGGRTVAWGDYDNDGDLDIVLTGSVSLGNYTSRIYRNDSGSFTDISASLTAVGNSAVAWGDYDADGDLDLLLAGSSASGSIARIYRNNAGTFSDISAGLTGVDFASAAWGDYDNDGDLDLLLAGNTGSSRIARIYQNNAGTFSDISAGLTGVDFASAAWGDYDNDGDLDLLLTGRAGTGVGTKISKIYKNTGGTFTEISASGLTGVYDGSVAWGDYDNDSDLDILLTGDAGSFNRITRVFQNTTATPNTPPTAPTGLSVTWPSLTSVVLTWNAPTDTQTPTNGLSYNLRVGTTPGGSDVVGPMALSNGKRTVAVSGTVETTTWVLNGLTPGQQYYWSVQAIDSAFAGSAFATESSFTQPQFTDQGSLGLVGGIRGSAVWGDYDNDGDLDVLSTGFINSSGFSQVFRNDGGTFVDISANLVQMANGSAAWGDYDNDGDLDILLTGRDPSNNSISKVYRNDNGTFIDIAAPLPGVRYSSVAWGDYDNDGDLDILLTGRTVSAPATGITRIYRNDGSDNFTDSSAPLPGVGFGSTAWGDYDNDGDLDILLTGTNTSGSRISRIYRNDGNGSFSDISAALLQLNNSSVAWGDYDNDGDLDILLSGQDGGGVLRSLVYRNDGGGSFQDISAGLTGVFYGAVAWGDYDNDGDLDILLTGRTQASARITRIYRNDSGTFTDISTNVTGVDLSSVAWGDYDNDNDLDILLSGRDGGSNTIARVFKNDAPVQNTRPIAPTGLTVNVLSPTSVELTWTAPTDTQTPTNGLSYNLRVGTTAGAQDVLAPMSLNTGLRNIAQRGLVQTTTWTLTDLTPGQLYYWSVQAIDTALVGSVFATETMFVSVDPGVSITQTDGTTVLAEGGATDTYTVVLNSQPTANVTIAITPDSQSTTSPTSLVFTPQNWNIAQTVTVTAVNDNIAEGNHNSTIQHTATSSDGNYNGISISSLTASITDSANTPSVTNSTTNEDTQTTTGLVISRNAVDGAEVTHVKITNITNGILFFNDGTTVISNGSFITIAQANAGLKFTPNTNFFGSGSFDVQASTSNSETGLGGDVITATITVNPVNDGPIFNLGSNQTVNEDAGVQTVTSFATNISTGPANESGQTLTFNVSNNNNSLFLVQPAIDASGNLTYTPAANANGSATVTVQLQDNGGTANGGVDTSGPQTFTITVNAVNDAPSFTVGANQTVNEDAGAQIVNTFATNISTGPANESGQTLTFNVSNNNNSLFLVQPAIDASGNLTYTPAANANGSATVTVQLQDNGGTANGGVDTSGPQTFTITVNAVNDAPSFTVGANQTVNEDAGAQIVNTFATNISTGPANESGQTLTFNVSNNNNSLFLVQPAIDASGNLTYTPAANANGSATVTVTLSDNGGTANGGVDTSASQTFTITVNAVNDAPSFNLGGNQTVNEDAGAQTVTVFATNILTGPADESGQTLTFTLSNDNNGLFLAPPTIDPSTGNLTYTPAANANGSATVTVALSDNGGIANGGVDTSGPQTFTITVNSVNDAPSITSGATASIAENSPVSTVIYTATAIDPDTTPPNNTLSFSLSGTDASLFTIDSDDGEVRLKNPANFEIKNSYSIDVVVTDGGNPALSDTKAVTIQVLDVTEGVTTPNRDSINTGPGNDVVITSLDNLRQRDSINGGTGNDTLVLNGPGDSTPLKINLSNASQVLVQPNFIGLPIPFLFFPVPWSQSSVKGFENVDASGFTGALNLTGSNLSQTLKGGSGADRIFGLGGDDLIDGGTGADELTGGLGNDLIYLGNDTVRDRVYYSAGDGTDTVFQFNRANDQIIFSGIVNINVQTVGSNTQFQDQANNLLMTLTGTTGFTSADVEASLTGSNFTFLPPLP